MNQPSSKSNQALGSGTWTYRSLLNNPVLSVDFDKLEFARANLKIETSADGKLAGKIYDTGWELDLKGSFQSGNPATLWFRGTGTVDGSLWVYDYLCYVVPNIPEGSGQAPALVGSVTRAIAHPGGAAGEVASFYAVLQSE